MQTLSSCVAITGDSSRFDAVVTGLPQPEIQWFVSSKELTTVLIRSKDGEPITPESHPHIEFMNRGSRVALVFRNAQPADGGKYMCIATNFAGVATSSAQFVVRSKTIAPDFAKRLISEELCEGDELRWTVKVSGEPDVSYPMLVCLIHGFPYSFSLKLPGSVTVNQFQTVKRSVCRTKETEFIRW